MGKAGYGSAPGGVAAPTPQEQAATIAAAAPPLTEEQAAQVYYPGTSYQQTGAQLQGIQTDFAPGDLRNFMYGRDPAAAQAAVDKAQNTGQGAQGTGENLLRLGLENARTAGSREAFMGDWTQQNAALQQAGGYGDRLAGLEATQGPSAAQAQLQAGTNQALASQVALARSGHGFGSNAAAAGQAQGNLAGIQANQANQSAGLRAQEDAAWRQRNAANIGAAAGIQQGIGSQFGEQGARDINAYYANQGQNDTAALGWAGLGSGGYFQGVNSNLQGQGLADVIRGKEMQGGQAAEDRMLRAWAAAKGFSLQEAQAHAAQQAAIIQGVATVGGAAIGSLAGPGGTAAGGAIGNGVGRAVTA